MDEMHIINTYWEPARPVSGCFTRNSGKSVWAGAHYRFPPREYGESIHAWAEFRDTGVCLCRFVQTPPMRPEDGETWRPVEVVEMGAEETNHLILFGHGVR
jgi:hypothetical protein